MRKKYKTLEEVRAANAARAREWRKANRWEARVKKARAYGTRTLKVDLKGYGTVDVPEWVLAVALPGSHLRVLDEVKKFEDEKLAYETNLEDCRTPLEKTIAAARGKRVAETPRPVEDQGDKAAIEDVRRWAAGRRALQAKEKVVRPKGGAGVEIPLEVE